MGSHIRRRTYSATESRLGLWAKAQQLWFLCEPRCFALHCCVCGSHFQRSGMAVSIGRKVRALQLLFFDPGCCHHPFAEVTFLFWVIFFVINVKQGQQKGGMTGERASKDIQRSSRAAILCGPSWRLASCRLRTWEQREPTRRLDSTYFKILSAALLVLIVLEGWKSHEEFTVSVVHIHKVWQDLVRRGLFNSFYLEDRPLYACAHQRHMIPLTIKTAWSSHHFQPIFKGF